MRGVRMCLKAPRRRLQAWCAGARLDRRLHGGSPVCADNMSSDTRRCGGSVLKPSIHGHSAAAGEVCVSYGVPRDNCVTGLCTGPRVGAQDKR